MKISFPDNKHYTKSITDFEFINHAEKKLLGTGSFACVKLAREISTGKIYALKIASIHPKLVSFSDLANLQTEIDVHKRIDHPNIIKFHDYFVYDHNVYMILDYAENGNLYHYLQKKKIMSESEAYKYFYQTCKAIEYLHNNNIMHRDIKPENLLLDQHYNIKLCDFGWSARDINKLSIVFCGTYEYMAPEIVKKIPCNYRVDIWALGILLYELIHCYAPYKGRNLPEISKSLNANSIKFKDNVSNDAKDLILKILTYNPAERLSFQQIYSHKWMYYHQCKENNINSYPISESLSTGSTSTAISIMEEKLYPTKAGVMIGNSGGKVNEDMQPYNGYMNPVITTILTATTTTMNSGYNGNSVQWTQDDRLKGNFYTKNWNGNSFNQDNNKSMRGGVSLSSSHTNYHQTYSNDVSNYMDYSSAQVKTEEIATEKEVNSETNEYRERENTIILKLNNGANSHKSNVENSRKKCENILGSINHFQNKTLTELSSTHMPVVSTVTTENQNKRRINLTNYSSSSSTTAGLVISTSNTTSTSTSTTTPTNAYPRRRFSGNRTVQTKLNNLANSMKNKPCIFLNEADIIPNNHNFGDNSDKSDQYFTNNCEDIYKPNAQNGQFLMRTKPISTSITSSSSGVSKVLQSLISPKNFYRMQQGEASSFSTEAGTESTNFLNGLSKKLNIPRIPIITPKGDESAPNTLSPYCTPISRRSHNNQETNSPVKLTNTWFKNVEYDAYTIMGKANAEPMAGGTRAEGNNSASNKNNEKNSYFKPEVNYGQISQHNQYNKFLMSKIGNY